MKFEQSFNDFLKNVVNLNQSRIDVAESAESAITSYLQNSAVFKDLFIRTRPQGSIRQKTIIKPVDPDGEFDVDLFFELTQSDGWEPKDYLTKIADDFRKSDRYKDKVDTRGKTRCVTLDYDSDFHLDIVPAIKANGVYWIMNKATNLFEQTDGDGYAQWFEAKNTILGKKQLTKVVRLVKYLRDYCGSFEVKSILLTTLLGQQVDNNDTGTSSFIDLPTAFVTLLMRLDSYLQANVVMPLVSNPVLTGEQFNRHWNQTKYDIFRTKIHEFTGIARDAYVEQDEAQSLKLWQKIFGDRFTATVSNKASSAQSRDPGEEFLSDYGIPENIKYDLLIDATVVQTGFRPFNLSSHWQKLKKKRSLEFFIAKTNTPLPYSVKWKVKNTGTEAKSLNKLRGNILNDTGAHKRTESTLYTGEHYVECYIIKDGVCVAKNRLVVPIDQE